MMMVISNKEKILDEVRQDPVIQKLRAEVTNHPESKPGFSIQQGVLMYQGRLVLSANSEIIPQLLKEFHETPMGGHFGVFENLQTNG
jgi:hypothetical protein